MCNTNTHFLKDMKKLSFASGSVLLVVLSAIFVVNRSFFMDRFGVVEEGVLYRSAALIEATLAATVDVYKIKTVVNLSREDFDSDRAVAKSKGINYEWIPFGGMPTPEVVDRFLAIMDKQKNLPVLVHCRHGVERTGTMVALYRIEKERWTVDRALREARHYALWANFSEGTRGERFLRAYVPRRAQLPEKAATMR